MWSFCYLARSHCNKIAIYAPALTQLSSKQVKSKTCPTSRPQSSALFFHVRSQTQISLLSSFLGKSLLLFCFFVISLLLFLFSTRLGRHQLQGISVGYPDTFRHHGSDGRRSISWVWACAVCGIDGAKCRKTYSLSILSQVFLSCNHELGCIYIASCANRIEGIWPADSLVSFPAYRLCMLERL